MTYEHYFVALASQYHTPFSDTFLLKPFRINVLQIFSANKLLLLNYIVDLAVGVCLS
jgi:hypothetical protein